MVFLQKKPREKTVLGRKTNFFLGKIKKTILLDFGRIVYQKMFFLVVPRKKLVFLPKSIFSLGKSWFFSRQNHLFPRKKLVFLPKTIVFPGKTQKTILFGVWLHSVSKNIFFGFLSLGKGWFWTGKPTSSYEKNGFGVKKQLFPRKKMVLGRKTNFSRGKTKKNKKRNHFLRRYAARLQKDCFLGFACFD